VKGKKIVCECVEVLFDDGLFVEMDELVCYCLINFG